MRSLVDDPSESDGFHNAVRVPASVTQRPVGCAADFATTVDDETDPVTVTVWGELDLAAIPMFRATMLDLARQGRKRVVLDLSQLDFIDCTGLRTLLAVCREWAPAGSLVVQDPSVEVRRLVELTAVGDQLAFMSDRSS